MKPSLQRATAGDLSGAALGAKAKALRREVHLVLKQVSYDYERMQYNTVVSGCMKLLNTLRPSSLRPVMVPMAMPRPCVKACRCCFGRCTRLVRI